jgi:hypothetical protein
MRTEAEVREAIAHYVEALRSRLAAADPETVAHMHAAIDLLYWMLGESSRFEDDVMNPCRMADRERKKGRSN